LSILIILGEKYKLRSSSLCSFLQPPVTSSLFITNIWMNNMWIYNIRAIMSVISCFLPLSEECLRCAWKKTLNHWAI
jgi:hypothetical protein